MKVQTGLRLLITRLGDQAYGLEASGLDLFEAETGGAGPVLGLHELLGYPVRPPYRSPVLARLRGASRAILLDGMEAILDVAWAELRPLPPLLEPHALEVAIWSVLPRPEGPVLVLETGRLLDRLQTLERSAPDPLNPNPNPMSREEP